MPESGDVVVHIGGVPVVAWNPVREPDGAGSRRSVDNAGDLLGALVVERMLVRAGVDAATARPSFGRRLVGVGSVLHLATAGDVVWGTGLNGKTDNRGVTAELGLDVRAVRGPLTARWLTDRGITVPGVLGDPVLLLPRLVPEVLRWVGTSPAHDVLVVPNLHDVEGTRAELADGSVPVVDPTQGVLTLVRAIARSRFVVASSLHAAVVADALGVGVRIVASATEHPFKYRDHLAATGRATEPVARTVAEAIDLGPHSDPQVDLDALERAFPVDLWREVASGRSLVEPFTAPPLAGWTAVVIDRQDGARARAAARLRDDLLPAVLDADATDGDVGTALATAREQRRVVLPDLVGAELGPGGVGLLAALDRADVGAMRLAGRLVDRPLECVLRGSRPASGGLLLDLAVVLPGTGSRPVSVRLRIAPEDGVQHLVEVVLEPAQRHQWFLDVPVLVPLGQVPSGHLTATVEVVLEDGSTLQAPLRRPTPDGVRMSGVVEGALVGGPPVTALPTDLGTRPGPGGEPGAAAADPAGPAVPHGPRLLVFPAWRDNPYLNLLNLAPAAAGWDISGTTSVDELAERVAHLGRGDVLHVHWTSPVAQAVEDRVAAEEQLERFVATLAEVGARGAHLVWTIHNALPHEVRHRDLEVRLAEALAHHADRIIRINRATVDVVRAWYELPEERVVPLRHASYLGVYPSEASEESARRHLGVDPGAPTVGFVGQIRPYKGVTTLLHAAGRLAHHEPDLTVLLAGKTRADEMAHLEAAIPRRVRLVRSHAFVPDDEIQHWLMASDVMVFPYEQVLNSGSVLLAATFGRPCVLPDEPALRAEFGDQDWVEFFSPGPGASSSLADAVRRSFERHAERVLAARSYAAEYRPYRMSSDYLAVLRDLRAADAT